MASWGLTEPDEATVAFRRLLMDADDGEEARIDALLVLSRRTVFAATWPGQGDAVRTLRNPHGETAMPIFTGADALYHAAEGYGWMNADGSLDYREMGAREALRHALAQGVHFLVVDLASDHVVEFARAELSPVLRLQARESDRAPQRGERSEGRTLQRDPFAPERPTDPEEAFRQEVRQSSRPPAGGRGSFRPRPRAGGPSDGPGAVDTTAATGSMPPAGDATTSDATTSGAQDVARAFGHDLVDTGFGELSQSSVPPRGAPRSRAPAGNSGDRTGRSVGKVNRSPFSAVPPRHSPLSARPPVGASADGAASSAPPGSAASSSAPPGSAAAPSAAPGSAASSSAPPGSSASPSAAPDAMASSSAPPRAAASPYAARRAMASSSAPPRVAPFSVPPRRSQAPGDPSSDAPPASLGFAPTERAIPTPKPAAPDRNLIGEPPGMEPPPPSTPSATPNTRRAPTPLPTAGSLAQERFPRDDETTRRVERLPKEASDADSFGPEAGSGSGPRVTALGAAAKQLTSRVGDALARRSSAPPRSSTTAPRRSAHSEQPEPSWSDDAETARHDRASLVPEGHPLRHARDTDLDDETLDAIGAALRAYPEVEWACALPNEDDLARVGLRIDPTFLSRADEITECTAKTALDHGTELGVALLRTPEQVRQARHTGMVFFPGRKRVVKR